MRPSDTTVLAATLLLIVCSVSASNSPRDASTSNPGEGAGIDGLADTATERDGPNDDGHSSGGRGNASDGNQSHGGAGQVDGGESSAVANTTVPDGEDDVYGPWAGGATYYAKFLHGPPSDPSFFPIAVWLQSPNRAKDYAAIGINTYVGLYKGPTEDMLTTLAAAPMPVACDQNSVGLAHVNDKTIVAWTQQDEPDNGQLQPGGARGPCIAASAVRNIYMQMRGKDATRPVFLNLGPGVAHDYSSWGSECAATHPADYPDYVKAADIVSFDIYPANNANPNVHGKLWLVADGVTNLIKWAAGNKPVWNWIECTGIHDPAGKPTPAQVKAEVWMSIVHGSMGIGYFVHQFKPTFDEHALLDDTTMKSAVSAINREITSLAPVLNTPSIVNAGTVQSSKADVPVDMLVKRQGGALYVFAVGMRGTATHATFSGLSRIPAAATATVLGENRTVSVTGGRFEDDFPAWGVRLYEIK